jgi:hypothetical protein
VYIGKDNTVLSTTGVMLNGVAGTSMSIPITGELWAISGGTQTISFIEIY